MRDNYTWKKLIVSNKSALLAILLLTSIGIGHASTVSAPWTNLDVDNPTTSGSATQTNDEFEITGAIHAGAVDHSHFVYQELEGSGQIEAHLESMVTVNANAKAGLIIRESTALNARHLGIFVTPGSGKLRLHYGINGTTTSVITLNGSNTDVGDLSTNTTFLRLVRRGNIFEAFAKGITVPERKVMYLEMVLPQTVLIGMAVNSDVTAQSCVATFKQVAVSELPLNVPEKAFGVSSIASNGASIGFIHAIGKNLNYSLSAGNAQGAFALDSSTGELTVADNTKLVPALIPTHLLLVSVTDGVSTSTGKIVVNVIDSAKKVLNLNFSSILSGSGAVGPAHFEGVCTETTWTQIPGGNSETVSGIVIDAGAEVPTSGVLDWGAGLSGVNGGQPWPYQDNNIFRTRLRNSDNAIRAVGVRIDNLNPDHSVDYWVYVCAADTSARISKEPDDDKRFFIRMGTQSGTGNTTISNLSVPAAVTNVLPNYAKDVTYHKQKVTIPPSHSLVISSSNVQRAGIFNLIQIIEAVTTQSPIGSADNYTMNQNGTLTVDRASGLVANDTDSDSNLLAVQKVSDPTHGSLDLNLDGSFTYTPNQDYFGVDSFTYKTDDGINLSATTTVTITINQNNVAPVAVADAYKTNKDTPLVVSAINGVLANDTDPDGDALTALLISGPAHGSLNLNLNGSFTYTPSSGYFGIDSFTYQANDGNLLSATTTVTITMNNPPVAMIGNSGPITVYVPGTVNFSSLGSSDTEGNLTYFWDFKDGTTSVEANPVHTFMTAGTYEVSLVVTDNDNSNSLPVSITVIAIETRGLLVKKGRIELDWVSHALDKNADSLYLEGLLDYGDIPADLTGVTYTVFVNGIIAGAEITFARHSVQIMTVACARLRFRVSSAIGRFSLKLDKADLQNILNFSTGYAGPETSEVHVRVVSTFPDRASISWANRLLFDFSGKANRFIKGRYRFNSETALDQLFLNKFTRTRQLDSTPAHLMVFKGFIKVDSDQTWDPAGTSTVTVGNASPFNLELVATTGRDGSTFRFKGNDVELKIDTLKNQYVLVLDSVSGSGLPGAAIGAATVHRLLLQIVVPQTIGASFSLSTEIELTRRQSTFTRWR